MNQSSSGTLGMVNNFPRSNNEDLSHRIFSITPYSPRADVEVPGGERAGATLLCSGLFLGLVGMTFTVMGWITYDSSFVEWTKLLGPILLSVGVTLVLFGVCKFKKLNCKFWKDNGEPPLDVDQMSSRPSFVFTGINQPITFHGTTLVQYIPPPYAMGSCDGRAGSNTPPGGVELHGVPRTTGPPQYCTIYPQDNQSFTGDNHATPDPQVDGDNRDCVSEGGPDGKVVVEETPPPAYEDIYPVNPKDNTT